MSVATPAPSVPAQTVASAASVTLSGIKPGHHLAPAAIGRAGEEPQPIFIQCPNWCVEDHVADCPNAVEDIVHTSDTVALGISSFLNDKPVFELYASVKADVGATDPRLKGAHVVLDDGSGEDAFLTPDMTDEAAAELITFAMRMKNAARVARAANKITGSLV